MATYIKTLKDVNGDVVLPRTRAEAVTVNDGEGSLQDHLIQFVDDGIGIPTIGQIDADTLEGNTATYFTEYTDAAVAALVDSSPATLDTLNELAAALGDDANFATTITNQIAAKANSATTLQGYGITDGVQAMITGLKLWKGTQAEYDAIGTKDSLTVYIIV